MSNGVTLAERRKLSKKASARRHNIRDIKGAQEQERLAVADHKANKQARRAHKTAVRGQISMGPSNKG